MAVYAIQVFIICAIIIVPFIIRPSSFAVCGRRLQLPSPPLLRVRHRGVQGGASAGDHLHLDYQHHHQHHSHDPIFSYIQLLAQAPSSLPSAPQWLDSQRRHSSSLGSFCKFNYLLFDKRICIEMHTRAPNAHKCAQYLKSRNTHQTTPNDHHQ